jgi:hypothetical protein
MDKETLRAKLLEHPLVERLLRNPNWKPAAMAAVAFFVDGKKCIVPSWTKSSTWAQVQMAVEEIRAGEQPSG